MSDRPSYSLALSDQEVERYRFMAQVARVNEAAQWERAGIVAGASVADLGCGPGLVLAELAAVVGVEGRVAGVDREASAVETATRIVADLGLDHATVTQGDAWASGLEAGTFDVVNIRHVLAHNTADDRARILEHARELLVPGGSIYVVDVDLTGGRVDPPDADLEDLLERYATHLRDTGRDPTIGPSLGSALVAAGFEQIERTGLLQIPPAAVLASFRPPAWAAREAMLATGHATHADIERWDRALTHFGETAVEDHRAIFMTVYVAAGRRPAG